MRHNPAITPETKLCAPRDEPFTSPNVAAVPADSGAPPGRRARRRGLGGGKRLERRTRRRKREEESGAAAPAAYRRSPGGDPAPPRQPCPCSLGTLHSFWMYLFTRDSLTRSRNLRTWENKKKT